MKKIIFIPVAIALSISCALFINQPVKEAKPKQAIISQTITENEDGSVTTITEYENKYEPTPKPMPPSTVSIMEEVEISKELSSRQDYIDHYFASWSNYPDHLKTGLDSCISRLENKQPSLFAQDNIKKTYEDLDYTFNTEYYGSSIDATCLLIEIGKTTRFQTPAAW